MTTVFHAPLFTMLSSSNSSVPFLIPLIACFSSPPSARVPGRRGWDGVPCHLFPCPSCRRRLEIRSYQEGLLLHQQWPPLREVLLKSPHGCAEEWGLQYMKWPSATMQCQLSISQSQSPSLSWSLSGNQPL